MIYSLAFILILIGLYGVLTRRNGVMAFCIVHVAKGSAELLGGGTRKIECLLGRA